MCFYVLISSQAMVLMCDETHAVRNTIAASFFAMRHFRRNLLVPVVGLSPTLLGAERHSAPSAPSPP